jgi:NADPH-dependent 2,4-dienoyl-CoA reductase/sulfur reductase-like enzyme
VDLGRALIADPWFPAKVASGRIDEIRRCIACNYCLDKRQRPGKQVRCAVNPQAGRESESGEVRPASRPRKILVIGGGVAGMEAAAWLAKRGHRVSLHEKAGRLGGQTYLAGLPPRKAEIHKLPDFQAREMSRLGVEVRLNSEITSERALEEKTDALVVAAGGTATGPAIPVDPKMKCVFAREVLLGREKNLGPRVVVLGGGFVGAETAEYICERKLAESVAICEMREEVAFDLEPTFREALMGRLNMYGVEMVTGFLITEVTEAAVIGEDTKNRRTGKIEADTVVLALGTEPVDYPIEAFTNAGIETLVIGDAREAQGIAEAVRDGYWAGISIS